MRIISSKTERREAEYLANLKADVQRLRKLVECYESAEQDRKAPKLATVERREIVYVGSKDATPFSSAPNITRYPPPLPPVRQTIAINDNPGLGRGRACEVKPRRWRWL